MPKLPGMYSAVKKKKKGNILNKTNKQKDNANKASQSTKGFPS